MLAADTLFAQPSLFGGGHPRIDLDYSALTRIELTHGAWVDHQSNWLDGHQALFDQLADTVVWEQHRRPMYDRIVKVPRLTGSLRKEMVDGGAPTRVGDISVIQDMGDALSERYRTDFDRVSVALYRDGNDSVAWHGDQVARELPQALVATVSLGEPRTFHLRPKGGGQGARRFRLGHGDLVVMGGTCQRTWEHSVPKCALAGPRIAIMFRPSWAYPE